MFLRYKWIRKNHSLVMLLSVAYYYSIQSSPLLRPLYKCFYMALIINQKWGHSMTESLSLPFKLPWKTLVRPTHPGKMPLPHIELSLIPLFVCIFHDLGKKIHFNLPLTKNGSIIWFIWSLYIFKKKRWQRMG